MKEQRGPLPSGGMTEDDSSTAALPLHDHLASQIMIGGQERLVCVFLWAGVRRRRRMKCPCVVIIIDRPFLLSPYNSKEEDVDMHHHHHEASVAAIGRDKGGVEGVKGELIDGGFIVTKAPDPPSGSVAERHKAMMMDGTEVSLHTLPAPTLPPYAAAKAKKVCMYK